MGWPNQPSSGTMSILHWDVFLCSMLPEMAEVLPVSPSPAFFYSSLYYFHFLDFK